MAYISQYDKAKLMPGIKAVLKKYGLKGSVSIRDHMALVVTIREGIHDLVNDYQAFLKKEYPDRTYTDKPTYFEVYPENIQKYKFPGIQGDLFTELGSAMKKPDWRDNSDIMTDYFDISYYMEIRVGEWDKPYRYTR